MIFSFNTSSIQVLPIKGLTLHWFREMIQNPTLRQTLANSITLSGITAAISTPLGLSGAYAMVRYNFKGKNILFGSVLIPLIMPNLVTGIAMINFFGFFRMKLSLWTGVMGEILITIPFTFLICMAGLYGFNKTLEEAAMDLGANTLTTFFRITLPILKPAVITSALFAFVISFNEFYVAFYTLGQMSTLPIWLFSLWFHGVSPDLNAASTIIVLALLALAIVLTKKIKIEQIVG